MIAIGKWMNERYYAENDQTLFQHSLGVSVVIRLRERVNQYPIGTVGIIISQARAGRDRYGVIIPGDPMPFFPKAEQLEVMQGVDKNAWWKR